VTADDDLCDLFDTSIDRAVDNRAKEILAAVGDDYPAPAVETIDGDAVAFIVASASEPILLDGRPIPKWAVAARSGAHVVYVRSAHQRQAVFFPARWTAFLIEGGVIAPIPTPKLV